MAVNYIEEIDRFVYGGYTDEIKRVPNPLHAAYDDVFVKMHGDWIPVEDWKKKHELPGARDLTYLARHFQLLGERELKKELMEGAIESRIIKSDDVLDCSALWADAHDYIQSLGLKPGDKVRVILIKED